MSNKETAYNDEVFTSEKAFKKRFRLVEGNELVILKRRIAKAAKAKKSRVTIYFDNKIINRFKELGEEKNVGYQTLMNDALLSIVDAMDTEASRLDLKEDILRDRKFLKRLKDALAS